MKHVGKVVLSLVLATLFLTPVTVALAHPLGNFTVNRYSRIELSNDRLEIRYVEDMAEIPTFQIKSTLDANGDGVIDDSEKSAYAKQRLETLSGHLFLTLNGAGVPLRVGSSSFDLLPGQAGLQISRLAAWLEPVDASVIARLGDADVRLDYRDDNDPERIGWREVIVQSKSGVRIADSSVPAADTSDELRAYPTDMLTSPLDRRSAKATFRMDSGGGSLVTSITAGNRTTASTSGSPPIPIPSLFGQSSALGDLISAGRAGGVATAVALVLAAIWGAAHALTPGHGKTVVAAYLVGSRGTAKHAVYLGLTVTATHTIGVYFLGLITLIAARYILPELFYPWLSLISGLAVVAIGLSLVVGRTRGFLSGRAGVSLSGEVPLAEEQHHGAPSGLLSRHDSDEVRVHGHVHNEQAQPNHHHDFDGDHDHHALGGQGHSHLPPGADGQAVTWRSLFALGVAGGLLPCPSALVLLLGAIAVGQVGFGLILVAVFSLGLALVLTSVGIALVYAGRLITTDRLNRIGSLRFLLQAAPIGSALVISAIGLIVSIQALEQTGLLAGRT